MYAHGSSTNDLGEYRMFGVAPGKYLLSATYRNFGMLMPNSIDRSAASGADENYVATYYPGTIDPSSAAQVEVTADRT